MEQVTDANSSAQIETGIARIRARFVSTLEDRADELYDLLDYLNDPSVRDAAYEQIQMRAHKLHGISGSLGFPRMGEFAAKLESTIDQVRSSDHPQNVQHVRRQLDVLLEEMEQSLNAL